MERTAYDHHSRNRVELRSRCWVIGLGRHMSKAGAKILSLEIVVCPVVICPQLSLHVHSHLVQKMDSFVKSDLIGVAWGYENRGRSRMREI